MEIDVSPFGTSLIACIIKVRTDPVPSNGHFILGAYTGSIQDLVWHYVNRGI
jgi:hypothetical protein